MALKWAGWLHNLCHVWDRRTKSEVGHKWAGHYITPAALGVPNALDWQIKSKLAHRWPGGYKTPTTWGVPPALERGTK